MPLHDNSHRPSSVTIFAPAPWQGGRRRKKRHYGKHDLLDYRHGWHGLNELLPTLAKHVFPFCEVC